MGAAKFGGEAVGLTIHEKGDVPLSVKIDLSLTMALQQAILEQKGVAELSQKWKKKP